MDAAYQSIDRFAAALARLAIRWRYAVIGLAVVAAVVVGTGAAFGLPGGGDLGDDVIDGVGARLDRARAGGVADGAKADGAFFGRLAVEQGNEFCVGEQDAIALDDLADCVVERLQQMVARGETIGRAVEAAVARRRRNRRA